MQFDFGSAAMDVNDLVALIRATVREEQQSTQSFVAQRTSELSLQMEAQAQNFHRQLSEQALAQQEFQRDVTNQFSATRLYVDDRFNGLSSQVDSLAASTPTSHYSQANSSLSSASAQPLPSDDGSAVAAGSAPWFPDNFPVGLIAGPAVAPVRNDAVAVPTSAMHALQQPSTSTWLPALIAGPAVAPVQTAAVSVPVSAVPVLQQPSTSPWSPALYATRNPKVCFLCNSPFGRKRYERALTHLTRAFILHRHC